MADDQPRMISVPYSEWEALKTSIFTLKRVVWLLAGVAGLLFVGLLAIFLSNNDQNDRLRNGREERIGYQADMLFLQCELAKDDVELLPENERIEVNTLCNGYTNRAEAVQTEKAR